MFPFAQSCPGPQAAAPISCEYDNTSSMPEGWTTHDSNLVLFDCLSQPEGRRPALPSEIIHLILAHPSRWILRNTEMFVLDSIRMPGGHRICHWSGDAPIPVITTRKLSRQDALSLGGIIFSFRSCDQGWSGDSQNHGTYNGSYSWMEAGIVGEDDMLWELQRNRHAVSVPTDYEIVFGEGHGLFGSLREGDTIGLWARAMYPGWQNFVYEANIEMWFYGPDDLQGRPTIRRKKLVYVDNTDSVLRSLLSFHRLDGVAVPSKKWCQRFEVFSFGPDLFGQSQEHERAHFELTNDSPYSNLLDPSGFQNHALVNAVATVCLRNPYHVEDHDAAWQIKAQFASAHGFVTRGASGKPRPIWRICSAVA